MLKAKDIIQQRLINQQIAHTEFTTPAEIVNWMIAMQAQEFAMAKWAIGLRLPLANEDSVDAAFNAGTILRTHLMRPTWHFVSPADIRWLLALTAPRIKSANAFMEKKLELDKKILTRTNRVIGKALTGSHYLLRDELKAALARQKIFADGLRLIYIMMQAELDGIICSGPRKGKQFTYALLEERVPAVKSITRKEALAGFAERYFTSRGPATVHDFAYWSGLTVRDATEGASSLPARFRREKFNEKEYIYAPVEIKGKPVSSFLMPIYDEYGMSYKDRSLLAMQDADPEWKTVFNNFIVIDGVITGGWIRTFKGKELKLETTPFTALNQRGQKELQQAIKKFYRFYQS